ncbi:MAG TPA: hypothetical protein VK363_19275 [Pyrinomonadaceae bacterium]|nr:hypothetical protein [Pyrinomonadaceae bacterium]
MTLKKKTTTRKGSAKRSKLTERAERIINNSDAFTDSTRAAVKHALDTNADDLAELVRRAESGEEIVNITRDDARGDAKHAAWQAERERTRTYSYEDSSRMYEEDNYAELLNSSERIAGLVAELLTHGEDNEAVALLTLVHAAASFENSDDRRHFCISVARACMDDVADVWGALGARLVKRAATDQKAE